MTYSRRPTSVPQSRASRSRLPTEDMIIADPTFRTYITPTKGSIKYAHDLTLWSRVDGSPARHPLPNADSNIAAKIKEAGQIDSTTYWTSFVIICGFYPAKTLQDTLTELRRTLRVWGPRININESLVTEWYYNQHWAVRRDSDVISDPLDTIETPMSFIVPLEAPALVATCSQATLHSGESQAAFMVTESHLKLNRIYNIYAIPNPV